jgi:hypothetical protein
MTLPINSVILITAWLATSALLIPARRYLRYTTLLGAWHWMLAGWGMWGLSAATHLTDAVSLGMGDQLWYLTAVILLCPLIAVLGAKRPGSRAWAAFVLVPLVVVLGWPAVTAWDFRLHVAPLQLETPAFLGYVLVLVMGAGNYIGTRFALASILWGAALLLLVVPLTAIAPASFPEREAARQWATVCLAGAVWVAALQARRPSSADSGLDRLWLDFRDNFGIVWAKRILDRMNDTAVREQWPAQLGAFGIEWQDDGLDPAARKHTEARIEHTFRWLLRRFVDEPWIDRRLS